MQKDYEALFRHLRLPEPPPHLFSQIMACIRREQERSRIRKNVWGAFGVVGSCIAFFLAFFFLARELVRSEFAQFLSLLFSNPEVVAVAWQDFTLLLLESLPAFTLAMLFGVVLTFIFSLRSLSTLRYVAR